MGERNGCKPTQFLVGLLGVLTLRLGTLTPLVLKPIVRNAILECRILLRRQAGL